MKDEFIKNQDEIKVGMSYEEFLEMIHNERKWDKKLHQLKELGMDDCDWMFYEDCRLETQLEWLMRYNALNLMEAEGDVYYDLMHDSTISDEYIAQHYYPGFDFC